MKAWWKWVLGAAALVLSAPLLVTGVLSLFLDQAYYKAQLSDAVESLTGRPLVIAGRIQPSISLKPRFSAESIRYPNAPWASRRWAVEVDRAVFSVDLWSLLRGRVRVEDVVLERPKVWVEKNASGVYNLAVLSPRARSGDPRASLPWGLEVSSAEIVGGEISVAARNRHWDIHIARARAKSAGPGAPVTGEFRGQVEGTPVSASGSAGSLETLLMFRSTPLTGEGWVGVRENRVRAAGSVRNLLKWRGIDLGIDFRIAHPAELSALAAVTLPDFGAVTGSARLLQPERLGSMALREIELQAEKWGLRTTMRGEIARVYSRKGIDLHFSTTGTLDYASPGWLMEAAGWVDAAAPPTAAARARLRGSAQDLRLEVETAELANAGLSIRAAGEVAFVDGAWRGALPVSLTLRNAGQSDARPGRALSAIGPLTAEAGLTWDQGDWRLSDLRLSVEREALQIKVAGAVNELTTRPSGHLYVIAGADDGRYLAPWFAAPLPPLSGIRLEAAFAFGDGFLRASVDQLAGRAYGADLTARGAIAELHRLRGIDLAVSGRADSLRRLPPVAGRTLPESGAVRAQGRLADDESGALHLTGVTASVSGRPLSVAARGEIRNLGPSMGADLDWELTLAEAEPVRTLLADSGWDDLVREVLPLEASGKVRSRGAAEWRVEGLRAKSRAADRGASLSGEIAAFAPLDARLRAAFSDLAVAKLPSAWNIPRPRDGALDLSLDLTARRGEFSARNIIAELKSPVARLVLHGDVDRLKSVAVNNMTLKFEADSVAALAWPAAGRFNPRSPVSGSVTLAAAGDGGHRSVVDVKIGANDVRGNLEWLAAGEGRSAPNIRAHLVSERFDLRDILAPAGKKTRFFSDAPIHTDWIRKLNGDLTLNASEAGNHLLSMRDVRTRIVLENGTLRQTVTGRMGQSIVTMGIAVDATVRPFAAEFKMQGKQLDSRGLVAFRRDDFLRAGTFDSDIEITARGASLAALAANADGRVTLRLNRARVRNQSLDYVGGDIFSNLVTIVNPFRSIGEYIDVECSVVRFDVERGQASSTNSLAMKTDRVTLLGGGNINLGDESLQILISPKARKGFGINPSSLVKIVRLGGTLADPKIETDGSRLLETGVVLGAAFYSGGLSLIAKGLLDRVHANTDVCSLAEAGPAKKDSGSGLPGQFDSYK